jgi:hypothetical protein
VGRSFASEASPLRKEFIQHQLPKDFIENLSAALDESEREIGNHAAWKTKRAHSTVGVQEGLASCATLLTRIDAIVGNTVSGNAPLAAEWEITRRLGRVRSRTTPAAPEGDKPQTQAADIP